MLLCLMLVIFPNLTEGCFAIFFALHLHQSATNESILRGLGIGDVVFAEPRHFSGSEESHDCTAQVSCESD
jgi:hypothetical protein